MRIRLSHACFSPLARSIFAAPGQRPGNGTGCGEAAPDHDRIARAAAGTRRSRVDRLADMDSRRVGRSGLEVSRLGLGTMTWGRDTDADAAAAQLEAFVGGRRHADRHREHLRRRRCRVDPRHPGAGRGEPRRRWCWPPRPSASAVAAAGCWRRWTRRCPGWRTDSRRPLAGARVRRRGAVRGDLCRAADRGRLRPRRLRRRVRGQRLAAGHPGRLAAAAGSRHPAGQRCSPSTRCSSGLRRSRWCRPRPCTVSGCWPGHRSAAACSPASTGTAPRPTPAAPHRISPGTSVATGPSTQPGSSRPWPPPPTGLGTSPLAVACAWVRDRPRHRRVRRPRPWRSCAIAGRRGSSARPPRSAAPWTLSATRSGAGRTSTMSVPEVGAAGRSRIGFRRAGRLRRVLRGRPLAGSGVDPRRAAGGCRDHPTRAT